MISISNPNDPEAAPASKGTGFLRVEFCILTIILSVWCERDCWRQDQIDFQIYVKKNLKIPNEMIKL